MVQKYKKKRILKQDFKIISFTWRNKNLIKQEKTAKDRFSLVFAGFYLLY